MKQYSRNQQFLLEQLSRDHICVSADSVNEDLRYLEQERLIVRASLQNRIITYKLSAKGEAYLEERFIDKDRYEKAYKRSTIALVISGLALIVSLASFVTSLL